MPKIGDRNNPHGRPKGSKNKGTEEMRKILSKILEGQLDNVERALRDLAESDSAKFIDALSKLINYVMPRRTDITTNDKEIIINWHENRSADYDADSTDVA